MTNHLWWYRRGPDESIRTLGEYNKPDRWGGAIIHFTDNRELAQWWARELLAGRPPVDDDRAREALRADVAG